MVRDGFCSGRQRPVNTMKGCSEPPIDRSPSRSFVDGVPTAASRSGTSRKSYMGRLRYSRINATELRWFGFALVQRCRRRARNYRRGLAPNLSSSPGFDVTFRDPARAQPTMIHTRFTHNRRPRTRSANRPYRTLTTTSARPDSPARRATSACRSSSACRATSARPETTRTEVFA